MPCSVGWKRPACVIAADERPGALTRIHPARRCPGPPVASGRQMSVGGSERAPRARPKVRFVLFKDSSQPQTLSVHPHNRPGGAGRRSPAVDARPADTSPRLGVHDAEAAHCAAVGGAPGRAVVLLWRDRSVLRLLGPGDEGIQARGNQAAPHDVWDAGQPEAAPDTGQQTAAR